MTRLPLDVRGLAVLPVIVAQAVLLIAFHGLHPQFEPWFREIYPPWHYVDFYGPSPPWPPNTTVQAPYGLPWYFLYSPSLLGYAVLLFSLSAAEWVTCLVLIRAGRPLFMFLFLMTAGYALTYVITDFWIYVPIVLSVRWRRLLFLAPLIKLPLGAPGWVWSYVFQVSLPGTGNWSNYLLIGTWWLAMFWYNWFGSSRLLGLENWFNRLVG